MGGSSAEIHGKGIMVRRTTLILDGGSSDIFGLVVVDGSSVCLVDVMEL